MNKILMNFLTCMAILLISLIPLDFFIAEATATYYIDTTGNNNNNGTSLATPWADFTNINNKTFNPGDKILLKSGCVWNQQMNLSGSGTAANWITLDSYGTGAKPKIRRSNSTGENCIVMTNPSYWAVKNIDISNAEQGILVNFSSLGHEGLLFSGIYAHDIERNFQQSPNPNVWNSNMLNFTNTVYNSTSQFIVKNIIIENCETYHTVPPQFASGSKNDDSYQNIIFRNNYFHNFQGAISLQNMTNVTFINNRVAFAGNHPTPQGSTGIFLWFTKNMKFINSIITDTVNTNSGDQCGIDQEYSCDSSTYHGCYFAIMQARLLNFYHWLAEMMIITLTP